ncbi:MAG: inner membrane CreD family protein [Acidobacteria bacterium]|nr:inner membrane CreD family protein [Acidobacteriota bacterium]
MIKHIAGIVFVFVVTSFAWVILGATVTVRTAQQDGTLRPEVAKLWGTPQRQRAPVVTSIPAAAPKPAKAVKTARVETAAASPAPAPAQGAQALPPAAAVPGTAAAAPSPASGAATPGAAAAAGPAQATVSSGPASDYSGTTLGVPLDSSSIDVNIDLEHRNRGLIWYSTYRVAFAGDYRMTNHDTVARRLTVAFGLPGEDAVYDNFHFAVDGKDMENVEIDTSKAVGQFVLAPGESKVVSISYNSQGLDEWWYDFGENVTQVRNFELRMRTSFPDVDFPVNGISPTGREADGDGTKLLWRYENLLSGVQIGMKMPQKLNPGPWVAAITFFAPVSLFFFFFLLFIFSSMGPVRIHPMNYFFIGTGFFSFHLLLTYLVDHISIHVAFAICSVVSLFLVITYMRLVVGNRFAILQVGISQLIYLVAFSYTFFLERFTGLSVTIMCVVTLFVVMQMTGRLDWSKVFASRVPE